MNIRIRVDVESSLDFIMHEREKATLKRFFVGA